MPFSLSNRVGHDKVVTMDNYSSRVAGLWSGGAAAEAAAIDPEHTEISTGTQLSLYVADGLLEVLEWAAQGQAADPPAAIWLALLRWYKNRYGAFPDGVPAAPDRWIDHYSVAAGDVDDATKSGLEEPEMGLVRKPHGVDAPGADALMRAAPLGMLPQMDTDWVTNMSRQVAVLTHAEWVPAAAYSLLIHHVLTGKSFLAAVTEVLEWLDATDDGEALATQLRSGLNHGIEAPTTPAQVLTAGVVAVADTLEQPVAPEQLYASAVTQAVHAGGHTRATALITGQLAGALLGNTATGTPSRLKHYPMVEDAIDRWIKLTT